MLLKDKYWFSKSSIIFLAYRIVFKELSTYVRLETDNNIVILKSSNLPCVAYIRRVMGKAYCLDDTTSCITASEKTHLYKK